jgi:glycosyltransferase involved in cell wall biosynthesis
MSKITALLHTENDLLRVGRCLETLYPCDEIIVVDNGSSDGTVQIAHKYGARVVEAIANARAVDYIRTANLSPSARPRIASKTWILCIDPHESLSESLAASLYEWKIESAPAGTNAPALSVFVREETAQGWIRNPVAQTRLVPLAWRHWHGRLPVTQPSAIALDGELLRFVFP